MSVKDILEANNNFQKKYQRIKVPAANNWAIVTCCDRRLSGLLEAAMGFRPGEAHIIRTAGAMVTQYDNGIIRSLSLLTLHENIHDIAVVGHSDCLAEINTSRLTEAMQKSGINRQAVGDDLREFYGLSDNPAGRVKHVVERIAKSGLIPTGINIHGFLIDTGSGRISYIYSHTIERIDIPEMHDTASHKQRGQAGALRIRTQDHVRGQNEVRQFSGKIVVPEKVRTSVESVKVPVNIRTPVREVKVPTKIRSLDKNIEVPSEIKMPENAVKLDQVGIELKELLERDAIRKSGKAQEQDRRSSRKEAQKRGQSQGTWDASSTRPASQPTERKYCPRCGAEYYAHVEKCADCRIQLVSKERFQRSRERQIRPVVDNRDIRRSNRDDRGRSIGNFRNRR